MSWRSMALRALLVVVTLGLLFVGVGALLSRRWHVERSVEIAAPPSAVHPFVEDLGRWQTWAFWEDPHDPTLVRTFSADTRGVGASVNWDGPRIGSGRKLIVECSLDGGVVLDSVTDECPASDVLRYEATASGGTRVTWIYEGTAPAIIGGYFRPLINSGAGDYVEEALVRLKAQVERSRQR